jgi:hypothetical protein
VVGGDEVQVAAGERGPERVLISERALGWRAHPFRPLDAGTVEHVFGLEQVMGAGLGPDRRATGAGGGDLGHGLGGETWKIMTGACASSARRHMRATASISAARGREAAWSMGRVRPWASRRARASAMIASFSAWMQVSAPVSRAMVSARRIFRRRGRYCRW